MTFGAARRRGIPSFPLISAALSLLFLLLRASDCDGHFGLSSPYFLNISNLVLEDLQLEKWMNTKAGDNRLLVHSVILSLQQCENQFRDDIWDCPLRDERSKMTNETRRRATVKKAIPETAFINAISGASLAHVYARACSSDELATCSCDDTGRRKTPANRNWNWGGCGDNLPEAKRFAKDFIRSAHRRSRSHRPTRNPDHIDIDHHNAFVGVTTVGRKATKYCKCHGISGSCELKTCWMQLAPFHADAASLKELYDDSAAVPENLANRAARVNDRELRNKLVHLESSPSYCSASIFSPGTHRRVCRRNCVKLCCGRGTRLRRTLVKDVCGCRVEYEPHIRVKCDLCEKNVTDTVCD